MRPPREGDIVRPLWQYGRRWRFKRMYTTTGRWGEPVTLVDAWDEEGRLRTVASTHLELVERRPVRRLRRRSEVA